MLDLKIWSSSHTFLSNHQSELKLLLFRHLYHLKKITCTQLYVWKDERQLNQGFYNCNYFDWIKKKYLVILRAFYLYSSITYHSHIRHLLHDKNDMNTKQNWKKIVISDKLPYVLYIEGDCLCEAAKKLIRHIMKFRRNGN